MLPSENFLEACLGWTLNSTGVRALEWENGWVLLGLLFLIFLAIFAGRKLVTSFLTLRALALAPTFSRRLSKWVKSYAYSDEEFLRADGVGERWIELRKQPDAVALSE